MQAEIAAVLKDSAARLSAVGIDTARLDAEILLAHLLGCERMGLLTLREGLSEGEHGEYLDMIAAREAGKPVAYITGFQPFWDHDFIVNTDTLIPRQDTETLVEQVLEQLPQCGGRILDLGTGSGCILLSILAERPALTGVGLDISAGALVAAEENAKRLGVGARAEFLVSDWFTALGKSTHAFTAIVSNPPYIPSIDIEGLMADVREHEPIRALDGGADGLNPYRLITEKAQHFLVPGGLLAVEVGILQANDVADLFDAAGFEDVQKIRDLPGVERVISGKKSGKG